MIDVARREDRNGAFWAGTHSFQLKEGFEVVAVVQGCPGHEDHEEIEDSDEQAAHLLRLRVERAPEPDCQCKGAPSSSGKPQRSVWRDQRWD